MSPFKLRKCCFSIIGKNVICHSNPVMTLLSNPCYQSCVSRLCVVACSITDLLYYFSISFSHFLSYGKTMVIVMEFCIITIMCIERMVAIHK